MQQQYGMPGTPNQQRMMSDRFNQREGNSMGRGYGF
jgi:hypothetical protein